MWVADSSSRSARIFRSSSTTRAMCSAATAWSTLPLSRCPCAFSGPTEKIHRIEQLRASVARMIARTHSATLLGVNAVEVEIECNEADGNQFRCTIVGLPDLAVKEARDRVLAAVRNSGFYAPTSGYLTFNLAPADLPKQGPAFDLPLAVTLVAGREGLAVERLRECSMVGELALN